MSFADLTIISGGQTGADRAALDFAIAHDMPHGGWCPQGRRAEDGPIAARYNLRETESRNYAARTKQNIRDADATVVFAIEQPLQGGTQLTAELAERFGKPLLVLVQQEHSLGGTADATRELASRLAAFVDEQRIARLNVAGPRASTEPRIGVFVTAVLSAALAMCDDARDDIEQKTTETTDA